MFLLKLLARRRYYKLYPRNWPKHTTLVSLGCALGSVYLIQKYYNTDPQQTVKHSFFSSPSFSGFFDSPFKAEGGQIIKDKVNVHPPDATASAYIKSSLEYVAASFVSILFPQSVREQIKEIAQTTQKMQIEPLIEEVNYTHTIINNKLPGRLKIMRWPKHALPPPLPEGFQPLTLCIEFELLYDPTTECLRAGTAFFLSMASQFCEVVVLTNHTYLLMTEALRSIDPMANVSFMLTPDAFTHGKETQIPITRDLDRLGRDLSKVICLDYSKDIYSKHPENVLILPQRNWTGNPYDTDLYDVLYLLKVLVDDIILNKADARELLPHYDDVDPAKLSRVIAGKSPNNPLHPNNLHEARIGMDIRQ